MKREEKGMVITVGGSIPASQLGDILPHEHTLVDFIGAAAYSRSRWDEEEVIPRVLPFLKEAHAAGWASFVDCTPNFLGRDPMLLKRLSALSGLQILTNTGFYGGSDEKFLPRLALEGDERALAEYWINEFRDGIDGSGVRPGFIKISVNPGRLSDMSRKLVRASAIAHLETGLTIMSHTGPGVPAMEQIEILKGMGVAPSAFIWTHAQNEKDRTFYLRAARECAWISLDGLDEKNVGSYVDLLSYLKDMGLLQRILLSHDAGWFDPAQENGGSFRGFSTLKGKLLPALRDRKFTEADIASLIRKNPASAFEIRVRPFPEVP